jgi:mRNA-degrading endonuclease YafQ of YafQ-DinJ toxin-antitoxin module
MFKIKQSKSFFREASKLIRQRRLSLEILNQSLFQLSKDPFANNLRTHKVSTRNFGQKYSSRINGDLRIIWCFEEDESIVILLLDIGGHSGNRSVYI